MNGGLVWEEKSTPEEVGFGLDPTIMNTLALLVERWGRFVAKEDMRKLMANIAPLAIRVMCVVMNDGRS